MVSEFGVFPSKGYKKDGVTPKTGWVEDEFTFLGIRYSVSRDAFYLNKKWYE
jgi:hypothetical protein